MRKPAFCICENKGAETDLVPYGFRYIVQSLYILENPKFRFLSDLVGNPQTGYVFS